MLPKCDVIIVVLVVVCGWYVGHGHGKYMSQCEFVHEFMKYSPQISRNDLNKWTCIAQFQSNFDASKRNVDTEGTTYHGLFQIGDLYWCSREPSVVRACNLPCSKLEDSYFGDDFQCAQKIHAEHLRIYGDGFSAWPTSSVHCSTPRDYASECLDRKGSYKSNSATAILNKDRSLERKMHKIYERCELARELYYVHDVPFEQVSTWVCIAKYESNFNTSAIGSGDHGLFQISDIYWCSPPGKGWVCGLSCAKLENADISDDVECMRKIYAEHQRLSGDGFNAWTVYPRCKQNAQKFIEGCFDGDPTAGVPIPKPAIFAPIPQAPKPIGKRYERCELAKELRFKHNLPRDQIHTWVCIAQRESSFDTAAVGRLNADGSGDHGLFQISDIYWCSTDGTPKACGVPCSKFEDSDISDDVQCVQRIWDEHQRLFGNGFHAWSVYEPHCRHQTVDYIRDCFQDESDVSNSIIPPSPVKTSLPQQAGKAYELCELANELRNRHGVPADQIGDWVCIAQYQSNLVTSARGQREHGLFQISNEFWCSLDGAGKGCNLNCAQLEDMDIADDIACARKIHDEHQKISGNGFTAWATYEPYCRGRSAQLVQSCFKDTSFVYATTSRPALAPKQPTFTFARGPGKIYERCELARELRFKHNIPRDQIHTWICIAQQQSQLNTTAIGAPYAAGSRGFGIFQISEAFWCLGDGETTANGCGLSCAKLLDDNLVDDVACARKIYDEHQRLFSNGFHAWNSYEAYCKYQTPHEVDSCFDSNEDTSTASPLIAATIAQSYAPKKRVQDRCALARELRFKQNIAADKLSMWLCIAEHEPSFDQSNMVAMNKIYELQQRLSGDGFQAWDAYSQCKYKVLPSADACFGEAVISTTFAPFAFKATAKPITFAPFTFKPFTQSPKEVTFAPFPASFTTKAPTKSPAASLFDLYLNQYSTRKPQRYIIPTIPHYITPASNNQLNTYKIPNFEFQRLTTPATPTTTKTAIAVQNDYFRNFVDAQLTKLTGSFSAAQETFVPLNQITTHRSSSQKPPSSTVKQFQWTTTTSKPFITTRSPNVWSGFTQKPLNSTTIRPFQWTTTTSKSVTTTRSIVAWSGFAQKQSTTTTTKPFQSTTTTAKPFTTTRSSNTWVGFTQKSTNSTTVRAHRYSFSAI